MEFGDRYAVGLCAFFPRVDDRHGRIDVVRQAGLFSAILTAFNVESYKLLQPPAPDPALAILERMSVQIRSFSVAARFINSTEPHYTLATSLTESPAPTRAHVWLNILWFSGLICSLASASIGIMVKQWLRELSTRPSGTPEDVAKVRQYRLNNMDKWRVAGIVSTLPVLLQLSLVLFLSGLLVLLWTLHVAVAAVSSALVSLLLTFMAATIILPAIKVDCCYISPPTHAILPLVVRLRRQFLIVAHAAVFSVHELCHRWMRWTSAPIKSWLHRAYMVIAHPESSTWSIREVQNVKKQSRDLAVDQIILVYSLTLQSGYLNQWGRVCLVDKSSDDVGFVMKFIDRIRAIDERRVALGLDDKRELEELEVWLYVLLRLHMSAGDPGNHGYVDEDPLPEPQLFEAHMTRARTYICGSIGQGRSEPRCRPDALIRILKALPSITPIIVQDGTDYVLDSMAELVMLLTRRPGLVDTWNGARYRASIYANDLFCDSSSS